jgi:hypothetical protein
LIPLCRKNRLKFIIAVEADPPPAQHGNPLVMSFRFSYQSIADSELSLIG